MQTVSDNKGGPAAYTDRGPGAEDKNFDQWFRRNGGRFREVRMERVRQAAWEAYQLGQQYPQKPKR